MKHLTKQLALLLAAVLCLFLTACSDRNEPGSDWRTTGIVRDFGTITRGGKSTKVAVCVHKAEANFYYDTEDQTLFDHVDYPITLEGDAWEMFQSIDFADLNGDGSSDVTMKFKDGGTELLMVWFWDAESNSFLYQPEKSQLGEEEGRGDLIPDDDGKGDTIPDDDGKGDLIPDDDGKGDLIPDDDGKGDTIPDDDGRGDEVTDDGDAALILVSDWLPFDDMKYQRFDLFEDGTYYYEGVTEDREFKVASMTLWYDSLGDWETVEDYLTDCALALGEADDSCVQSVAEDTALSQMMSYPVYIVTYTVGGNEDTRAWTVFAMGTDQYTYLYGISAPLDTAVEMESVYRDIFANLVQSDAGPDWDYLEDDTVFYSWDSELRQRNVSEFEGVWYYDGDLSAMAYIVIDAEGNWGYYERAEGDAEGTEMDHGTFSYSADEVSTYYADSAVYEGLSFRVFEYDEGILFWNEDVYYREEDCV